MEGQVNILGQMRKQNFLQGFDDGEGNYTIIGKDGVELIPSNIKCPFYDAPLAKGNKGLMAFFSDVSANGALCFSNDVRWVPVGGRANLLVKYNATPTRSAVTDSRAKVLIPYSPLNGSFWQQGDIIRIQSGFQRLFLDAGDNTKTINREIYIGSSGTVTNNKLAHTATTGATNDGVPERGLEIMKKDSTTVQILGANVPFNTWNGANTNDLNSLDGVTNFTNMDTQDTYLDYCFRWSAAPAKDAAHLYSCLIELIACGPGV